jgi:hypothetical protein
MLSKVPLKKPIYDKATEQIGWCPVGTMAEDTRASALMLGLG